MKKPEILAPCGSPEALRTAIRYGADAVYLGAEDFGLRAMARNFHDDEIRESVEYAHARGVRVYVTANIFARNDDIDTAKAFFLRMKEIRPDAFIISDPGIFMTARRICPEIEIHISTQSNSTNYETCLFWASLGATRIVLARELSMKEIADTHERLAQNRNAISLQREVAEVSLLKNISPEESIHGEEALVSGMQSETGNDESVFRVNKTENLGRICNHGMFATHATSGETAVQIPELECFVHGAMCMSYSGRCFLSSYMTGRDANQGACTHPCRFNYALVEEHRPGEYMPVFETETGTAIMASGDLCMLEHVDELIRAGVDSLKIEGRMKSPMYVATVVRAYRHAVDAYFEYFDNNLPLKKDLGDKGENIEKGISEDSKSQDREKNLAYENGSECPEQQEGAIEQISGYESNMRRYLTECARTTTRPMITGFYYHKNASEAPDIRPTDTETGVPVKEQYRFLGVIEDVKEQDGITYGLIMQRNKFAVGDVIGVMRPAGDDSDVRVEDMIREDGTHTFSAPHAREKLWIGLKTKLERGDILRG